MNSKKLLFAILFVLACASSSFGQIVYQHDFGTTAISAHPYTVVPTTLDTNLNTSSWVNSLSAWTSFGGSTGQAISFSNSSGTPTATLTFNVASGYQLSVTAFSFWRQRSTTGAQNWSMTINGISVGSGTAPTSGTDTGTTSVASAVSNQTGTITVVMSLSGASGTGTFRIDDFTLIGTVTPVVTGITTANNGNWNVGTTWTGGVVPTASQNAIINHNVTLDVNVTRNSGTTTTINAGAGKSLATGAFTYTNDGTTN
ncbi:hypothetical protein, partial [Flavobacterium sp.]|uniref:hypothetical protein n=1 Tax=Flavobacterium sp. TaxID=239 RepID=UPI002C01795E